MELKLLFARAANGVIGKAGALPWHLPEDMAHFRQLTTGHPVIMGRKTWDSIPPRFRPLPGRRNIVVTRQADWASTGAQRAASLVDAIALCANDPQAWVIGGAQLYAQALPLASTAEITEIEESFSGDVHAPELGAGWKEVSRERHVSSNGLKFSFATYQNTQRGD